MKVPLILKNWIVGVTTGFVIGFCLCYLLFRAGVFS